MEDQSKYNQRSLPGALPSIQGCLHGIAEIDYHPIARQPVRFRFAISVTTKLTLQGGHFLTES